MTGEMVRYYAHRATEYDAIYDLPQWQADLQRLRQIVPRFFAGCTVFEVACGTGYWTRYVAQHAMHVEATDVNTETLAVARSRDWPRRNVVFQHLDAYAPSRGGRTFDSGLAAFWLSHVDLGRMRDFLAALHSHLAPGASVLMFDERETPGRPLPASRIDDAGNRYERRKLANGERFEIIKNFYDHPRLESLFAPFARDSSYDELDHFWLFSYSPR